MAGIKEIKIERQHSPGINIYFMCKKRGGNKLKFKTFGTTRD